MNTNTTSCATCAAPFEARSARARYCSASCRAKAHRQRPAAPAAPDMQTAAEPATVGPIEQASAAKLGPVQNLDAVTRATLLGIARRLDDPNTPGGAVATLNKELHRCFKELDIAPPVPSALDEARLSAARKLAALTGARS